MRALQFSRVLAIALGILAPLGETIRRWHVWREYPPAILDDYLMGALLLWGAWAARGGAGHGRAVLIAAWGFTCGLGYMSFFEQVRRNLAGELDPAFISGTWVAVIKGIGLALAISGLIAALGCRERVDSST